MRCRHVKLVKADGKVLAALGCSKLIGGPAPAQRGHDGQRIRKRLAGAGGRADAQVVRGAAAAGGLAPRRSLHREELGVAACTQTASLFCCLTTLSKLFRCPFWLPAAAQSLQAQNSRTAKWELVQHELRRMYKGT